MPQWAGFGFSGGVDPHHQFSGLGASVSAGSGVVRQRLLGSAAASVSGASAVFSAFSMKSVPGLLAYWDAAFGVHLNVGHVSALDDQSGTGDVNKNATQATAVQQPTYTASDANYNGQPTFTPDNSAAQGLITGTWASALVQPFTTILVGNTNNNTGTNYFFDGITAQRAYNYDGGFGTAVGAGGNVSTLVATMSTYNTPSSVFTKFNGAASSIAVRTRTPQVVGDAGTQGAAGMTIGNGINLLGAAFSTKGPIALLAIYDHACTVGEIDSIATYITKRFGVAIGA